MAIKYIIGTDGSFTAGDTDTRITSYSYPTSDNATAILRRKVAARFDLAREILTTEAQHRSGMPYEAEYDARNWRILDSMAEAAWMADSYLWGKHTVTGRWANLQGPSDLATLGEYQRHFAKDTLADAYARVPHSGFAESTRPTYSLFKISARRPRDA